MRKKSLIFIYGMGLSAIAGFIVGLFYVLQSFLIEFFWHENVEAFSRPVINAIILLVIGIVIFLTRKHFGQLPRNFSNVMAEIRRTGTVNYRILLAQMVIPAVILVSGTSLGPEATLVSSTVLYGIWIGDKLRYVEANYEKLTESNWQIILRALLIPHHYLIHRENSPEHRGIFLNKKITKIVYFLNGILWFSIVYNLFGEPSLIIRIGESNWHYGKLGWMLLILLVSYATGYVYLKAMIEIRKVIQSRLFHEITLITFGGLAIYVSGLLAPEILFSGQHNFHLFTTNWVGHSVLYLIVISFAKLLLLTIALNTGWVGGDIFPVLFSATIQGLAVSQLLPSLDRTFVMVMVAIGVSSAILESPLLVGSLMAIMFAPLNLLPFVILATILLMFIKSLQRRYTKYAPTVFDQIGDWLHGLNIF